MNQPVVLAMNTSIDGYGEVKAGDTDTSTVTLNLESKDHEIEHVRKKELKKRHQQAPWVQRAGTIVANGLGTLFYK